MAKRPNAKGKTIDFIPKGSDSGPGGGARVKSHAGAPTLYSVNRGEKTLEGAQPGVGRVFPPVYGSNPGIGLNRKSTQKKKSGGGYVPSAGDLTASPNPF